MKSKIYFLSFILITFARQLGAMEILEEEFEKTLREQDIVAPKLAVSIEELSFYKLLTCVKEPDMQGWYEIPQNLLEDHYKGFAYNEEQDMGIRGAYVYQSPQINRTVQRILVMIMHGTGFFGCGGPITPAYYDIKCKPFKNLLKYAKQIADNNKTIIEVLSFRWPGFNTVRARRDAGNTLGQFIVASYQGYDIRELSHSHGANVTNAASHILEFKVLKDSKMLNAVNYMFFLGPPVRTATAGEERAEYTPANFNVLFSFWSPRDWIQGLGAIGALRDPFSKEGSVRKYGYDQIGKVYNIRVQVNGKAIGHTGYIDPIAAHLYEIQETIEKLYVLHTDLDLDISDKGILVSIRNPLETTEFYTKFLEKVLKADPEMSEKLDITQEFKDDTRKIQEREKKISEEQKALYKARYGYSMGKP